MATKSSQSRFSTRSVEATRNWIGQYKYSVAVVAGMLLLWWVYTELISQRGDSYLPSPDYVIVATAENMGRIIEAFNTTFVHVGVGFVFAVIAGIAVGVVLSEIPLIRQLFMPGIVYIYSIPRALMAPLFVIWFGLNPIGIGLFVAWNGFFVIMVNTITGLTKVSEEFHHLAEVSGATKWQTLKKIKFWAAMPHIAAGMKIAIQQAIVGAIIAEFIATGKGLGYLIMYSASLLEGGVLFGALIILMVFSAVIYYSGSRLIDMATPGPSGS